MTPQETIAFGVRRANRELKTDTVLSLLKTQLPRQYDTAEIVGQWLWLDFPKDRRPITYILWTLGFHWNQRRYVWQHPCGAFCNFDRSDRDPRERYGSRFVV
jgi:hypothetical protein